MRWTLAILITAALIAGCAPICENEVSAAVRSPSGKMKAVVFDRGCGATVGFNTQLSVLSAEAELPDEPGVAAVQLRGMATAAEAQRSGLGRALVLGCVAFARKKGARLLWCNARTYAAGFYSKLGFEIVGKEFDIPDVGPHYRMKLQL